MRDDQVRRYARHILVPDIGGLGQTALLASSVSIAATGDVESSLIAAMFLAAGGVGSIQIDGLDESQQAAVRARGPDAELVAAQPNLANLALPPKPAWWPSAPGDDRALAYWRGSIAATCWMAGVANA